MQNDKENSRRSFIQKIAFASAGALVGKAGFTQNTNKMSQQNAIKQVKALGFQWETQDPFLFCVHHEDFYPQGNKEMGPAADLGGRQLGQDFLIKDGWRMYHGKRIPGFPGHPHRGFETITVVRKGMVDHTDSMGASGRYGDGDVQWMTAGKGVQHAEMFPLIKEDDENPMELFQIWINLPKANKFVEPHFKMLWEDTIPKVELSDSNNRKVTVELIAGTINENKAPSPPPNSWAANPANEVAVWNIQLEPNATWKLPTASKGINRSIYFFKGESLKINSQQLEPYHAAEVDPSQNITITNGSKKGYVLILQGKPIGEPVVQHGPFVMNTKEEIQQTFSDYQQTQFGGWPWKTMDPVHSRDKGRFAKHADGTVENKG